MSPSETKLCPFCGEEIKEIAIKCRYCGSMLGGDTPQTSSPGGTPLPGGISAWMMGAEHIPGGTEIQNYRIDSLIGSGGMGEVYLAEHTYTGQKVAIKAVHPGLMSDLGARRRFLEEGRVMAALKHPGIVSLLNFFEEARRFFLVMEYIAGHTLEARLRQGSIPEPEAVRISGEVLAALGYAHSRPLPVVHRDIKPANVMLEPGGRVVLMDFGIAKALGRGKMTATGGVVGTYEYMSPEQVRGGELGPASDLYSVGIMLYRMLAGAVPFPQTSDTGIECMNGHISLEVPPLSAVAPHVGSSTQAVVARALEKDPARRFASAGEMAVALTRSEDGVTTEPPPMEPPPSRPEGRSTAETGGIVEPAVEAGEPAGHVPAARAERNAGRRLARRALLWLAYLAVASSLAFLAACFLAPTRVYSLTGVRWPLVRVWDFEMIRVPEGDFIMGCEGEDAEGCWGDERPLREEFVEEFWIDRTEVTNEEYSACVSAGACTPAHAADGLCTAPSAPGEKEESTTVGASLQGARQPVVCVDADQARDYCRWRGKRLPSDDEWERAARGTDGRLYPWGYTPYGSARVANIADEGSYSPVFPEDKWVEKGMDDGFAFTAPVGSFPAGASPCGALDMAGNVLEWVEDRCWYCSGPEEAKWVRGGSWRFVGLDAFTYSKHPTPPLTRRDDIGFRCAVSFSYY